MAGTCVRVARGLLLYGDNLRDGVLDRRGFMAKIGVNDEAFRAAGTELGAIISKPRLRFFHSERQQLAFGPGAGVVLGFSVGPSRVRAVVIDANGESHHPEESATTADLRERSRDDVFRIIRDVAAVSLRKAIGDSALLVDGHLPLLGIAGAWGGPLTRGKQPSPRIFRHESWHGGASLVESTARYLAIEPTRAHALNDAQATGIAVAFKQTRARDHVDQSHTRLGIAVRLAGNVSAAVFLVEPPPRQSHEGPTSGLLASIVLGGRDYCAGEIGHLPIPEQLIDECNKHLADDLQPLAPVSCSCAPSGPRPNHLEALTSIRAVAARVAPAGLPLKVVDDVIREPSVPAHRQALKDVGTVLGHALSGSVAMLNPATITLTSTLAVAPVADTLAQTLERSRSFGGAPEIAFDADKFTAARGAALAVIRGQVYRRLDELLGGKKNEPARQAKALVMPITRLPWASNR